jgi:DHA1 family bicyclomycin/chloramphenicol resistance-like MFS transporter
MAERDTTFDKPQVSQRRVGLVIIIGALTAFGPLSMDMYLPGLPSISQDLGSPAWQIQLTLTACLLGLAVGQVIAGPLSDKLGRRKPLLVGLFTYTVASLLCAIAPSGLLLILFRLLQGLAGAAGIVLARAAVRDIFSGAEVARFFAMTMAVNGLAPILAPVIGGQILNFTSWRGVFVLLTAIGIILLVSTALGLEETLPVERRRSDGISATLGTFGQLLRDRHFMGYALSSSFAFAAMFAYISGSPFVLENIYKVSPQIFSLIFASNALGIIVTSQISGRLVGKVGPRKLLAFGLGITATGGIILLAVAALNLGLIGLLPALFITVCSIGFIAPNATALALADYARNAGSASAFIGVIQYIIGAAVTPLVSLAGESSALPMSMIIAFFAIAAVLIFVTLTRSTRVEEAR